MSESVRKHESEREGKLMSKDARGRGHSWSSAPRRGRVEITVKGLVLTRRKDFCLSMGVKKRGIC